jgi:carbonic anhydrase
MKLRVAALLFASLGCMASAQTPASPQDGPHWDYVGKYGPLNWGKLDPSYRACSAGKEQSPVDLRGAKRSKTLKPVEFHYMAGPVQVVNNGHTIQVDVAPGSYIVADGVRYDLVEFHFHHPSEEAIKGRLSDMVVHLVHKSADGKLAVVAVLFNEDINSPNALLSTLWANLPKSAGQSEKIADGINAGGLLPADRNYWTYTGSLTTPPCTEGVKWFVLQQPMTIGRTQLRTFAALFPINSRPLQDLHGRKIEASQ